MPDGSQSTDLIHAATDTALMPAGGGFMAAPRTFQDLKEMAKYMAKGELMVGHSVRGNPGDCMAVTLSKVSIKLPAAQCTATHGNLRHALRC